MKNDSEDLALQKSRQVIESLVFADARRSLSIYVERLFLKLILLAQSKVNGIDFSNGTSLVKIDHGDLSQVDIIIPIKELLGGDSNSNYNAARDAIDNIKNTSNAIEIENEDEYQLRYLFTEIDLKKRGGIVRLRVSDWVWKGMLSFTKGFRKYDFNIAMGMRSRFSLYLFKMISNQTNPIHRRIDDLKHVWDLDEKKDKDGNVIRREKYRKTNDFVEKTILVAKKELDKTPWTFDYELVKSESDAVNQGRSGPKKYTSITFYPVHQVRLEKAGNLSRDVSPFMFLGLETVEALKKIGFTDQGIQANLVLLNFARKKFSLLDFIEEVRPSLNRSDNPPGIYIGAIKKRLREKYGVDIKSEVFSRDIPSKEELNVITDDKDTGNTVNYGTRSFSDEELYDRLLKGLVDDASNDGISRECYERFEFMYLLKCDCKSKKIPFTFDFVKSELAKKFGLRDEGIDLGFIQSAWSENLPDEFDI